MKKISIGKSGVSGKGGFAAAAIRKGEVLGKMSGRVAKPGEIERLFTKRKIRWDDPFELGNGQYLILDPIPLSINHSCVPNVGIRKKNELVALRNIKKGEELFYDYSTVVGKNAPNEEIDWKMRCRCGNKTCRKTIGNWQTLSKRKVIEYQSKDAFPNFILKQIRLSR